MSIRVPEVNQGYMDFLFMCVDNEPVIFQNEITEKMQTILNDWSEILSSRRYLIKLYEDF